MAERQQILVLNQISATGLKRLPAERYTVGKDIAAPDAVLVRSADMHGMDIPASVKAIGRAGAVNARAVAMGDAIEERCRALEADRDQAEVQVRPRPEAV